MRVTEQSTQQHWDRIYQHVGDRYQLYLYQPQLVEVLEQVAERVPGGMVLEVGCGKGNELLECAKRGLRCVGIDFSEKALHLLRKRVEEKHLSITLLRADTRALPFVDNSFDLVFSQGVLEHFRDPQIVLQEQFRVLRPGGYLVVEVPNRWTLYTIYKKMMMALHRWAPGWETEYSPRELRALLEAQRFVVTDLVGWDFLLLKVYRKIRRWFGVKDRAENTLQRSLRRSLQRNPFLLYFFESITVVGQKPDFGFSQ